MDGIIDTVGAKDGCGDGFDDSVIDGEEEVDGVEDDNTDGMEVGVDVIDGAIDMVGCNEGIDDADTEGT